MDAPFSFLQGRMYGIRFWFLDLFVDKWLKSVRACIFCDFKSIFCDFKTTGNAGMVYICGEYL